MNESINIVDPYENYDFTEEVTPENLDFLETVQSLQVGFGSKVLRVDRDGLWLGAEDFASAPFSVDMEGNVTADTIDLSGFLQVGDALSDVQSDIFDLSDIDSDLGYITAGTLVGIEVRGSLIRTSTSGARVEIDGSNDRIEIYDSAGEERMRLDEDELQFYNSLGNEIGYITTPSTSNFFIGAKTGNYLILESEGASPYGVIIRAAGGQVAAFSTAGITFSDQVDFNNNTIQDMDDVYGTAVFRNLVSYDDDIEPFGGAEDVGNSTAPWDQCHSDDFFGIYNAPSDKRLKKDIASLGSALSDLLLLRPVSFKYKPKQYKTVTKEYKGKDPEVAAKLAAKKEERKARRTAIREAETHYGFIAQEVQDVLPNLVKEPESPDGYLSLKYDEVVPLLVKAVQEQQEQIEALQAQLNP